MEPTTADLVVSVCLGLAILILGIVGVLAVFRPDLIFESSENTSSDETGAEALPVELQEVTEKFPTLPKRERRAKLAPKSYKGAWKRSEIKEGVLVMLRLQPGDERFRYHGYCRPSIVVSRGLRRGRVRMPDGTTSRFSIRNMRVSW